MNTFKRAALILVIHLSTLGALKAQLPEGFTSEFVVENIENVGGIRFLNDSTSILWTFDGKVYVMLNDVEPASPILDISDEVGFWGDHGMLGFAVHPDFLSNGWIYMLYQVDTYQLIYGDSVDYNPFTSWNYMASIGRLTRYQLDTSYPNDLITGSRAVLIGASIETGIPQMSASHGVGSLEFGSDKSLLVSTGEGSTWVGAFTGGPPYPEYAFDEDGLEWGIIGQDENIGSYRAQYLDSYSGKLLRIDPLTGLGLSSNPFFAAEAPDSPRSKVWSLGLRNPFRIIVRPGTGSSLPGQGDPGSIYIGDVGYYNWEEINVANGPALNFGWPQYEGMETFIGYDTAYTYHPSYLNPLFGPGTCIIPRLRFQDLLIQPTEDHVHYWGNPCDPLFPLNDTLDLFVHERPALCYSNEASEHPYDGLVPGFDVAGNAVGKPLADIPDFSGEEFKGIASVGGDFYQGTAFPEEYFGAYFQSDYSGWFKAFWFDENDQLEKVQHFSDDFGLVLATRFNPFDECLYLTAGFPTNIVRMCYAGNVKPHANIQVDTLYGSSPLTVNLDASLSWDPDEDPLSFSWDLGDGAMSDLIALTHTFSAPDNDPYPIEVTLAVTDTAGNTDYETLIISLNNTPPSVNITSIVDSSLYSTTVTNYPSLIAEVMDAEHDDQELVYQWQTVQHHNTHSHANPYDYNHTSSTVFEPAGCEEYATYYYSVSLKVTDPAGLSGYDERIILPDCEEGPNLALGDEEFFLYPNPNSGNFTIRGPLSLDEKFQMELYDTGGRRFINEERRVTEQGRLGFSFTGLVDGYYILRLSNERQTIQLKLNVYRR